MLPLGLISAGAALQRLVDQVFSGLQDFASAYMNDTAVLSNSWSDPTKHSEIVLGKLGMQI